MTFTEIISAIDAEIAKLQQVRAHLTDSSTPTTVPAKRGPGRPKKSEAAPKKAKRVMSVEARARIAAAQKKRWAAAKKAAK